MQQDTLTNGIPGSDSSLSTSTSLMTLDHEESIHPTLSDPTSSATADPTARRNTITSPISITGSAPSLPELHIPSTAATYGTTTASYSHCSSPTPPLSPSLSVYPPSSGRTGDNQENNNSRSTTLEIHPPNMNTQEIYPQSINTQEIYPHSNRNTNESNINTREIHPHNNINTPENNISTQEIYPHNTNNNNTMNAQEGNTPDHQVYPHHHNVNRNTITITLSSSSPHSGFPSSATQHAQHAQHTQHTQHTQQHTTEHTQHAQHTQHPQQTQTQQIEQTEHYAFSGIGSGMPIPATHNTRILDGGWFAGMGTGPPFPLSSEPLSLPSEPQSVPSEPRSLPLSSQSESESESSGVGPLSSDRAERIRGMNNMSTPRGRGGGRTQDQIEQINLGIIDVAISEVMELVAQRREELYIERYRRAGVPGY